MWEKRRFMMVEKQILERGIGDRYVIEAMRAVPRHLFVPLPLLPYSYHDTALAIGYGQTISQPYIVAYMIEALHLDRDSRVLEIGTGSGYEAAVLSRIVREVVTIERLEVLVSSSRRLLSSLAYDNIQVVWGDGYDGYERGAPYDAIIVSAAPPEIPKKLIEQLKPGGRLILPLGRGIQRLLIIRKNKEGVLSIEELLPVMFVPMVRGR